MNYKLENGVDFYNILKKELTDDGIINTDDICLISRQPLEKNNVELPCKHKFNYLSLYHELLVQKHSYNSHNSVHLQYNQIKCPYCRGISNRLIPYLNIPGVAKTHGVNYPLRLCMKLYDCQWTYKNGKRKGQCCPKNAYESTTGTYCEQHKKMEDRRQAKIKLKIKNGCISLLKSGKRKGETCNCKSFKDNMCKRHYQINNLNSSQI